MDYIKMRTFVLATLCLTAFGVNLRSAQTASIDVLQPAELALQVFGQSFDTVMQGLETQLLALLYPDNAADVQAQVDACETNFWNTEVADLQAVGADLNNLVTACTAADPNAPVTQLVQDTLSLLTAVTAGCDGLSVNLAADINNLIANLAAQGFQFAGVWTGPLAQLSAAAVQPLEVPYSTFDPVANVLDSIYMAIGTTREALDGSSVQAQAIQAALYNSINDIAATGVPSADNIASGLNAVVGLVGANAVGLSQAVQGIVQQFGPVVQGICSFVGPLLSFAAPPSQ